jgi:hypothetical protein
VCFVEADSRALLLQRPRYRMSRDAAGSFSIVLCEEPRPVACCSLLRVPEPPLSWLQPAGVVVLAGLRDCGVSRRSEARAGRRIALTSLGFLRVAVFLKSLEEGAAVRPASTVLLAQSRAPAD